MKLWLFTFTAPDRKVASMRVAAPTREEACSIVMEKLERPMLAAENTHPESGTILTAFGALDTDEPGIVAFTDLNGRFEERVS